MKLLKEYFPLIVSVIVITVIGFFAMPVMAQQNPVQKWPAYYDCGPTDVVKKLIEASQEVPTVESIGVLQIPGDTPQAPPKMYQAPVIQYYNAKTGTYTIIADFQNGYSCILLFGHGLKAATPGVKIDIQKEEWKEKFDEMEKIEPKKIKTITDNRFELT